MRRTAGFKTTGKQGGKRSYPYYIWVLVNKYFSGGQAQKYQQTMTGGDGYVRCGINSLFRFAAFYYRFQEKKAACCVTAQSL